jgi:hypothetical protein
MLTANKISIVSTGNLTCSFNQIMLAAYNPQLKLEQTLGYGIGKGILHLYNNSMNYFRKTSIYRYFNPTKNQRKKMPIKKQLTKKIFCDLNALEKHIIKSSDLNDVFDSINKFYNLIPPFLLADVATMNKINEKVSETLLSGSYQTPNQKEPYDSTDPTINTELLRNEFHNFIRNEMNKNLEKPILFLIGELHGRKESPILESLFIRELKNIIGQDPVVYIESDKNTYDKCIAANKARGCDTYTYRLATLENNIALNNIIPCDMREEVVMESFKKYGMSCRNSHLTPRDIHIANKIIKTTYEHIASENSIIYPQISLGGEDHIFGLQKELKNYFHVVPVFLSNRLEEPCKKTLDLYRSNDTEGLKTHHILNVKGWQISICEAARMQNNDMKWFSNEEIIKEYSDFFTEENFHDAMVVTKECNIDEEVKYAVDSCKHRLGVETDVYSIDMTRNKILYHYDAQKRDYAPIESKDIKKQGKQTKLGL